MKNAIIWVIVIIIVILSVGAFFMYSPKGMSNNNNPGTPSGGNPGGITSSTVDIKNFAFNPKTLTIAKGTTVTWTNNDPTTHIITSATFNSGNLSQGHSFFFTFNDSGTYDYHCSIHPYMTGQIIVQ